MIIVVDFKLLLDLLKATKEKIETN
jgi:hypothetical protein